MAISLFDKRAQYSPSGIEDYVSGKNTDMGYQGYQQGGLSLLGKALSGVGAAFAGDSQWLQRQTKMDQEAMQADLEFKAALQKQYQDMQDKKASRDFQDRYLQTIAGSGGLGTTPGFDQSSQPTLAEAFPIPGSALITKQGISSSGKPYTAQVTDPKYAKSLELRNTQIKDVEEFSKPLETFAVGLQSLREAVNNTPEFKPGIGGKFIAKGANALAAINNEKWYNDYDLAYNQNILPAAQSLGASKVLSDRDLENIKKSLGDYSTPRDFKIKAIDTLINKLGSTTESKLKAYGANKDIWSSIYPNASKELGINKNQSGSVDPRYQQAIKAGYTKEEIDAYLKGKK